MNIYSYTPNTTPGPNGYTIRFAQPAESHQAIELIEIGGRRYVGVPSVTTMPEQPAEIDWRAEPDPPAEVFASRWHTHILAPQLASLAAVRWQKVAAGTIWNGWPVKTGPADIPAIHAVYSAAQSGSRQDGATFKFGDGIFRPLTNAEAIAMGDAIFAWVQAHFEHEAVLDGQLRDGQNPNITAGWPNG